MTPEEVADAIADLLGLNNPEDVMIEGRSGRISLTAQHAADLVKLAIR